MRAAISVKQRHNIILSNSHLITIIHYLIQLHKEINLLRVELAEMKERMKELNDLKELIWKSYTSEFCKQL